MKNLKEKILGIVAAKWVLLLPAKTVLAQDFGDAEFDNPIGPDNFAAFTDDILDVVLTIGTVLVVLAIIYAGFMFVTAQGNDEKLKKAKHTFIWVVIGAVILLGAKTLGTIICNTAGEFDANVCD